MCDVSGYELTTGMHQKFVLPVLIIQLQSFCRFAAAPKASARIILLVYCLDQVGHQYYLYRFLLVY